MTTQKVFILDTEPMNANSNDLFFTSAQDIPSWMHDAAKKGEMNYKEMEISEDYYRFNPDDSYSFTDAHKIVGGDKYLLVTSFADQQAQAEVKTFEQLLKLDVSELESENERLAQTLQDIEI